MLGTLARRVTVLTLNQVVERGEQSPRRPVRLMAKALHRAQGVVGLGRVETTRPLPSWNAQQAERPMWGSDQKKLRKWQLDQGILKDEASEAPAEPARSLAPSIEVYFKRGCPYARAAIELLREREIPFVEHDVKGDPSRLQWLTVVTGRKTTPQIFLFGQPIGGYDELRGLDGSGELARRLAAGKPEGDGATVAKTPAAADEPSPDEISVADLRERMDEGAEILLLDVREPHEVGQTGVLAHAVLAPMGELHTAVAELDRESVWVVYCHAGVRSAAALPTLHSLGFRRVVSLRGGVLAWTAAGGELKPANASKPRVAVRRVALPVLHPERSPFETPIAGWGDVADEAERLEGADLVARVREVLDECRPMVQQDGGDIELLDVQVDVVHVQLTGNCIGCPSSQATLRQGIERRLRAKIPQIKAIASPQLRD